MAEQNSSQFAYEAWLIADLPTDVEQQIDTLLNAHVNEILVIFWIVSFLIIAFEADRRREKPHLGYTNQRNVQVGGGEHFTCT